MQGVGFRWFVRVAARRLQLSGWVRNHHDGTVEVVAAGPDEKLAEFRRLVSRGPDAAEVTDIRDLGPADEDLEFPFAMKK